MRTLASVPFILSLAVTPCLQAQVLDLGGGGAFTNPIVPVNGGRASGGWFWDNLSADATLGNSECNAGFFAVGAMDAGCANQAPGTFANQGGFDGGTFWSNGDNPAPFMFSGAYDYQLRLVGSLAGKQSEFGIFTRSWDGQAWVYAFTGIPAFGSKSVGSVFSVGTGLDWGFYIRNTFNPTTGGCESPDTDCSDATGGYSQSPFNQFVLMRSSGVGGYRYLVGAEDNELGLLPNASYWDSDYNDYLVEVTVTPEPASMALVATGLVALSLAGYRRRRRES